MKTSSLLLLFIIMTSSGALMSQTERGRLFLQGSSRLGANVTFNEEFHPDEGIRKYRQMEANFNPMIGYIVADGIILGLSANVEMNRTNYIDSEDFSKGYTSIAGPFFRFYLVNLKGFQPMLETGVMIGRMHNTYKITVFQDFLEYETKSMVIDFWAGTGGTYFITDFLGIDFLFGYALDANRYKDEDISWDKISNLFVKAGVVVTLGKKD